MLDRGRCRLLEPEFERQLDRTWSADLIERVEASADDTFRRAELKKSFRLGWALESRLSSRQEAG